jgi:hypothetical protein
MSTIRHISVGSAFRVGAALYVLIFAVVGFSLILLPGIFGAGLLGALLDNERGAGAFGAGFIASVVLYVIGIIVSGIGGGIAGAVNAWLYNIVAGWVGGLEVDIS